MSSYSPSDDLQMNIVTPIFIVLAILLTLFGMFKDFDIALILLTTITFVYIIIALTPKESQKLWRKEK